MVEVSEDIHQTKLYQEVGNFLDSGFLGLPYVGINVSHQNGVFLVKAGQGLLPGGDMP